MYMKTKHMPIVLVQPSVRRVAAYLLRMYRRSPGAYYELCDLQADCASDAVDARSLAIYYVLNNFDWRM